LRRFVPFIIVALVGFITVGAGTMLYRAKRPVASTISEEKSIGKENQEPTHVRGPAQAPVTLEEFGDFQCPPCGMISGPLLEIEKDYGPKLRVIFRNFPFPNHQHALEAAYAAEAAGLQGRYWEMHDLLYKEQANWSNAPDVKQLFVSYAKILGLEMDRFETDMAGPTAKARVTADQERGKSLGVNATPSIFINNQGLPPKSLNPTALRAAIEEALKEKERPTS
jgi:protein-disulfide isomerase